MEHNFEDMAKEFLKEFYRMGRLTQSKTISHSMKGEAFLLLYLLQKGEGASAGELGRAMKSSTARVAAALNSLERKGRVVRKTDEKDRRKVLVELTEDGRKKAEECRQVPEQMVTRLMEQLGEEDAQQMLHILKRITEIMPQMTCGMEADSSEEKHNRGGKDDIEV